MEDSQPDSYDMGGSSHVQSCTDTPRLNKKLDRIADGDNGSILIGLMHIMKSTHLKKIAVFCLLLLSGGILFSSFHYHSGGEVRDNCPVCRFQDSGVTATSVDIAATSLPTISIDHEIDIIVVAIISSFNRPLDTLPNAPPSIS